MSLGFSALSFPTDILQGLVVEDAISGLTAGRNAGSSTLAVCTSSSREVIIASGIKPNYIATDLTKWAFRISVQQILHLFPQGICEECRRQVGSYNRRVSLNHESTLQGFTLKYMYVHTKTLQVNGSR